MVESIIDSHYENMFAEICDKKLKGDLVDLVLEVKLATFGKTIRRSWSDRHLMLAELATRK